MSFRKATISFQSRKHLKYSFIDNICKLCYRKPLSYSHFVSRYHPFGWLRLERKQSFWIVCSSVTDDTVNETPKKIIQSLSISEDRNCTCEQIDQTKVGSQLVLQGWAQSVRNKGNLIFIILRDRSGTIQCTIDNRCEDHVRSTANVSMPCLA